jgi:hypothetical protein
VERTENTCFISCYDPLEKRLTFVSTTDQVTASAHVILRQDSWNTVLGNMRHVQVIRQNSVASTMANLCSFDFIYQLGTVGTHQHCSFLYHELSFDHSW